MSALTKAECERLPDSVFADEARRLIPVLDQHDLRTAVGRLSYTPDGEKERVKRRIITIALERNWTQLLPKTWERDVEAMKTMQTIFSLGTGTYAGDSVVREGKIFEAGNYPDKNFEMTPDELRRAAAAFQPVPIDLEHTPTVLDGKLGMLEAVRVSSDGRTLFGTVRLPRWLDDLLKDGERKVSCTWLAATKRLQKLALVMNPRVSDAALMTCFAQRHDTVHGQSLLQQLHDQTARTGAICLPPPGAADFHSQHERNGIQAVHDVTVAHGAMCAPRTGSAFSGDAGQAAQRPDLDAVRDQGRRFVEQSNAGRSTSAHGIGGASAGVRAQGKKFVENYNRHNAKK
jgi:hypothetical protein